MGRTARALADLENKVSDGGGDGLDRLRLVEAPLVPEVRLHLAEDAILWWARMEAEAGRSLDPPFWASAWLGGQALARYVLDHAELVAGRRVLDLASGCGLAAIAAALAGASTVTANDVDPYALAAIMLNARANGVVVEQLGGDLLDSDGGDADLVLAGDVFYSAAMAARVLPFLERVMARGADVLVGDPGRDHLPREYLRGLATYPVPGIDAAVDAEIERISVFRPRTGPVGRDR